MLKSAILERILTVPRDFPGRISTLQLCENLDKNTRFKAMIHVQILSFS